MAFDPTDRYYQEFLQRTLDSESQVIPFVGAGLSIYGDQGTPCLPSWKKLLEALVAEGRDLELIEPNDTAIDELIDAGRLIEAAERATKELGEPVFKRVVQRELDEAGLPIPPGAEALVSISWPLIVTTNLDRMLANAYVDRHARPMRRLNGIDTGELIAAVGGTLRSRETILAQIHGDIDTYRSWCITESHYRGLLAMPGYLNALESLFIRRVFFVGFGLEDMDFDRVVQTIAEIYPEGGGEAYALIPRPQRGRASASIRRLLKLNGLRPIFYDAEATPSPDDPFRGHRAAYECLDHLASAWRAAKIGIEVDLKYFPELDPDIVGREREVAHLAELLVEEGGQIVQLVGLGGLGKTSLVQRFIARRRREIAGAGYERVFGCSFYRADIGQFIHDMVIATVGEALGSLPDQVDAICAHVSRHRTMIVLDGVEAILDEQRRLRNPYVLQILDSVIHGGGGAVLTSRVQVRGEAFERAASIDVEPLSTPEILELLDTWGLDGLGMVAKKRLVEICAGHPLALRILAGVLRSVPAEEAAATIEFSSVIDIADEVDPLRENRLARVFDSYIQHVDEAELAFLTCSSAFQGTVPYPLAHAALSRHYPDTEANAPLLERDLRLTVGSLLERRLLTVGADGTLSSHPTVREYFERLAWHSPHSLAPIHRFLAAERLRDAPELPESFEEAAPLLAACRHAAASHDWELYEDLFRRRLMRGFRHYLCNNLGAWEESVDLARLGEHPGFPVESFVEPGYCAFTIARGLKHLGRSGESRAKYLESLRVVARRRDPETAMYVNNFLTLLVWRGELAAADRIVELNVRALSWIAEPWQHRWQIEHGFSSLAYLRTLQGDLEMASDLFDYAARAWDDYEGERLWVYDYYPYYRSEAILAADPAAHGEALDAIEALLLVARSHGWPESICRGHVQAAGVHLDRAARFGEEDALEAGMERLEQARAITAGMTVADVAIAHQLTWLKGELVRHELQSRRAMGPAELEVMLDRADGLIRTSGLGLAGPDAIAARGAIAHLRGHSARAREMHARAVRMCWLQGNGLAPGSPRSLVHWLGERLGIEHPEAPTTSMLEPIELVGTELSPEWMTARLEEVA
jgi:hypothetical protein